MNDTAESNGCTSIAGIEPAGELPHSTALHYVTQLLPRRLRGDEVKEAGLVPPALYHNYV